MPSLSHIDAAHQALGEFVIAFQWIEHEYRQIGWFILDPEQHQWPPLQLRTETNYQLIEKVTQLFVDLANLYSFPNGATQAALMQALRVRFHALRKYRNRMLHSSYVELKAGGEVLGYLRANPEIGVDPETGELIFDQEDFSANTIMATLLEHGQDMMHLGMLRKQLIHWYPFSRHLPVI